MIDDNQEPVTKEMKWISTLSLEARLNAEDSPRWHQATNGPYSEGYCNNFGVELDTLKQKME